jgi:hypothetical protein
MPQLDVFFDESDTTELIRKLLERSCYLVPDLNFPYPSADEWIIHNVDEYLRCRAQTPEGLFFALSPEYSVSPLEFREIQKEGRKVFYISQKTGGPTLDLFLSKSFDKGGKRYLSSGFIGYHPEFWNTATRRMESPPQPLKTLFSEIRRELKKHGIRKSSGKRTFWIGKAAQIATKNGAILTNPPVR